MSVDPSAAAYQSNTTVRWTVHADGFLSVFSPYPVIIQI